MSRHPGVDRENLLNAPLNNTHSGQLNTNFDFVDLDRVLDRCRLPPPLLERLRNDAVNAYYTRLARPEDIGARAANSSYSGTVTACLTCKGTALVQAGTLGILRDDDEYVFLAPGYHTFPSCGTDYLDTVDLSRADNAVKYGSTGFITVSEGKVGVVRVGALFRLVPPGTYTWTSPSVSAVTSVDVTKPHAQLGPYTLITVPDGHVAVTYNNGQLRVLGGSDGDSRTYFLDDPKWVVAGLLSLKVQTDRLESNDLLSKDNVELVMVAMSQWSIVDPILAITRCADTMDDIRTKVNQLVRATIARIVAATCLGAGPVSGSLAPPVAMAQVADGVPVKGGRGGGGGDDVGLARLMQSEQATQHMAELTANMNAMGVHVVGVHVPEKRMKNNDIRHEVAKQAVIGIKAEADRSAADAQAYATVKAARAEAEAIEVLAKAHAEAGDRLGAPGTTAARMALTETTSKALQGSKLTVFSGMPNNLPFMLNGTQADTAVRPNNAAPPGRRVEL